MLRYLLYKFFFKNGNWSRSEIPSWKAKKVKDLIDSGWTQKAALTCVGISRTAYIRKLKNTKKFKAVKKESPVEIVKIKATHNPLPIPRPIGGDKEVWDALLNSRRKVRARVSLIHIYAALNDTNWLKASEIAKKLECTDNNVYGLMKILMDKKYIEAIEKPGVGIHSSIRHYRRKVPFRETRTVSSFADLKIVTKE